MAGWLPRQVGRPRARALPAGPYARSTRAQRRARLFKTGTLGLATGRGLRARARQRPGSGGLLPAAWPLPGGAAAGARRMRGP